MATYEGKKVLDTRYVVTVKVERVQQVQKGDSRGGHFDREVSTVANLNIGDKDLPKLIGKVTRHLELVDDSDEVNLDDNKVYRPIRDNPQA